MSEYCLGIRFSNDGSHVVVAEDKTQRMAVFTTAGVFVRSVARGLPGGGTYYDVVHSVAGEYVVADYDNHRVCVVSPDGLGLVRSWGACGPGGESLTKPAALSYAGKHLYVMEFRGECRCLCRQNNASGTSFFGVCRGG